MNERRGTNNDKTNATYETTDAQTMENCNRGITLERSVGKLGVCVCGFEIPGGLCYMLMTFPGYLHLYSRLSLSRLCLSRKTAYLEVKIWSPFKHLLTGNKILWKSGEIAPSFTIQKWGLRVSTLYRHAFVMKRKKYTSHYKQSKESFF